MGRAGKRAIRRLAVAGLFLLCAECRPLPSGEGRPTASPTSPPDTNLESLEIGLESVVDGLDAPLFATGAGDGTGRVFVVEQTGAVRVVVDDELAAEPFLDISNLVIAGGEQGLLGLAFHPDYATNGRFFVDYTDTFGNTVVAEYRVSESDESRADAGSARILLTIDQPFANHNGGALAFGLDGYLYIATGDGGSAGDPLGNGQDLGSLLGKLLRIDVGTGEGSAYSIPPDNPFVDRSGARPEIWAFGLRNPWRFSFDEPAGTLWIADVGQDELEEVNRVSADSGGLDYGWNAMEGPLCFQPPEGCKRSGRVRPLTWYSHSEGCSVTGGYVYRGRMFPLLRGVYLFSDYCSGTIWGVKASGSGSRPPTVLSGTGRSVSSFGVDEDGEIYITDIAAGELLHVTAE
jgi:glucose/arabinose dehydrogenase